MLVICERYGKRYLKFEVMNALFKKKRNLSELNSKRHKIKLDSFSQKEECITL